VHTRTTLHSDATRHSISARAAVPIRNSSSAIARDADALDQSMRLMGALMVYPRNSEIFGENEPADYIYEVVSGNVRTYKILSDGRHRQKVKDGLWPGGQRGLVGERQSRRISGQVG
jgi:CRP-like cAMP-binding protein